MVSTHPKIEVPEQPPRGGIMEGKLLTDFKMKFDRFIKGLSDVVACIGKKRYSASTRSVLYILGLFIYFNHSLTQLICTEVNFRFPF